MTLVGFRCARQPEIDPYPKSASRRAGAIALSRLVIGGANAMPLPCEHDPPIERGLGWGSVLDARPLRHLVHRTSLHHLRAIGDLITCGERLATDPSLQGTRAAVFLVHTACFWSIRFWSMRFDPHVRVHTFCSIKSSLAARSHGRVAPTLDDHRGGRARARANAAGLHGPAS